MKRIFLFTVFTTFISTFQTLSAQMKNIHITPEETTICYKINKSASTALRKQLHLSEEHTFQNIRTETDSFGYSHERFEQYYKCGCTGTARRSLLCVAEIAHRQSAGRENISERGVIFLRICEIILM